ncbi:ubiquitin-conjugating enzyme/RWD-like protein [Dichotomopilus funicola]|uniref:Ubiquitin-conjugating enzyme/RWD-like protein n=1 Tax=Dichotomopilus funicola TaxID=1934379 RepID=A0AAN6V9B3_9PEZI|nr:ubiquitin-conjugating enzyme/RWD-like protein [Dichotomopilus funicola]
MATPTPKFNSKSPTIRRILREAHELTTSPSPDYHASPLDTNLFEWHFTLRGPPSSPFSTGIYHGRIILPPSYPLRPPSFRFSTPSGRFETNREICLSISGHHEETWQPAWGIRTALVALRTFMETDVKGQLGGLEMGEAGRRRLAGESRGWRCGVCGGGRSNEEILGEWGGSAEQKGGEEVVVPAELKMGWRDEMEGKGKGKEIEKGKGKEEEQSGDEESAALAEGFVQTAPVGVAPVLSAAGQAPARTDTGSTTGTTIGTAATTAGTTGTTPGSSTAPPRTAPSPTHTPGLQQLHREAPIDESTVWLDRLIAAVAILLLAVIAKVMLS